MAKCLFAIAALLCLINTYGQEAAPIADNILQSPTKFLNHISQGSTELEEQLVKKTDKMLDHYAKLERKLRHKIAGVDSGRAKVLFTGSEEKYNALKKKLHDPGSWVKSEYVPHLDSLTTSLKFLQNNSLSNTKGVQQALANVKGIQDKFSQADEITDYLKQRRDYLKNQLSNTPWASQLKKYNAELYYYGEQVKQLKSSLSDPDKLVQTGLSLLSKTKAFAEFWKNNSTIGRLFSAPGITGSASGAATLPAMPGLQTSQQVLNSLDQRLGGGGAAILAMQKGMSDAQSIMQSWKDKIPSSGGSTDQEMPDFKPNSQKIKSFFKRIEVGTTFQNVPGSRWLPSATQLGITVGYKLNDRCAAGIGIASLANYHGSLKNLSVSYQGTTIQTYVDWQFFKSFCLSGGFEMVHLNEITKVDSLKSLNAWAQKGLIGLSKKYQITKKVKGKVSLYWNFLSYYQKPQMTAFEFRTNYSLH